MKSKEIYLVQIKLRQCIDKRPCVILENPVGDRVKIAVISSALDLMNSATDFLINSNCLNFCDTGLTRTSYISGNFIEINISQLSKNPIGVLQGDIEIEFDKWFG